MASANNPSGYGAISYAGNTNPSPDPIPIPESLNITIIMVLSVVAVLAGSVIFSKKSKTANLISKTKSSIP